MSECHGSCAHFRPLPYLGISRSSLGRAENGENSGASTQKARCIYLASYSIPLSGRFEVMRYQRLLVLDQFLLGADALCNGFNGCVMAKIGHPCRGRKSGGFVTERKTRLAP